MPARENQVNLNFMGQLTRLHRNSILVLLFCAHGPGQRSRARRDGQPLL